MRLRQRKHLEGIQRVHLKQALLSGWKSKIAHRNFSGQASSRATFVQEGRDGPSDQEGTVAPSLCVPRASGIPRIPATITSALYFFSSWRYLTNVLNLAGNLRPQGTTVVRVAIYSEMSMSLVLHRAVKQAHLIRIAKARPKDEVGDL